MTYIKTACAGGGGGGGGTPSYPGNDFELFFRNSATLASSANLTFTSNRLFALNATIGTTDSDAKLNVRSTDNTFANIAQRVRNSNNAIIFDLRSNGNVGINTEAISGTNLAVKSSGNNFADKPFNVLNTINVVRFDLRGNGNIGFGTDAIASTLANYDASTAARSSLNLNEGVNVTTPVNGDLWYNGTQLFFRNGSTSVDLLAANKVPAENGWIPRTNVGGTFSYEQYYNWRSGILQTPIVEVGNGPIVTITPNGSLLHVKSEQNTHLIPAITYENSGFGVRFDMRTNGIVGIGGAASQFTALNINPLGGSALRINPGGVPSAPVDGDIWHNIDKLYIRLGGLTREFAFV